MTEIKLIPGGVCAAQGFTGSGIHCGIRKNRTKRDLALILSSVPASVTRRTSLAGVSRSAIWQALAAIFW